MPSVAAVVPSMLLSLTRMTMLCEVPLDPEHRAPLLRFIPLLPVAQRKATVTQYPERVREVCVG